MKASRCFPSLSIILLVAIGAFFRFYRIEHKVFWHDEVLSAIRVAGYATAEVKKFGEDLVDRRPTTFGELARFFEIGPEREMADILRSSLTTPHFPLYYMLLRGWGLVFGDSIATVRAMSAFISLLAIGAGALFARKLFHDTRTTLFAVGLLAVSPFQVLYAQETRVYALLILAILLSSTYLLKAVRGGRTADWILFGSSSLVGGLSHLLYLQVIVAQGLFALMVLARKLPGRATTLCFAAAFGVPLAVASPWLYRVLTGGILEAHETARAIGPALLFGAWYELFPRFFSEVGALRVLVLAVIVISLVRLFRDPQKDAALLLLVLALVPTAGLMFPDLLWDQSRSTVIRYLTPFGTMISFIVGRGLATMRGGAILFLALGALGTFSLFQNSRLAVGNAAIRGSRDLPGIIAALRSSPETSLLTDADIFTLLTVSRVGTESTRVIFARGVSPREKLEALLGAERFLCLTFEMEQNSVCETFSPLRSLYVGSELSLSTPASDSSGAG